MYGGHVTYPIMYDRHVMLVAYKCMAIEGLLMKEEMERTI